MARWKRNLMILWFGQFLVTAAMSSIIPFLPLYLQDLGVTDPAAVRTWSGIIFGANFLTAFIFSPIWGKLADRYGRKMMLIRSGIGMAVIVTLMGFATNHIQLLILRLLNGTVAGFIPAAISLTATNTPKEQVNYALGVLQSGAVAGMICGPLIGGLMADLLGFRAIFSYTGIFIFAATLMVLFLVKESFQKKTNEPRTGFIEDFKIIVSRKPILSLFAVALMMQLVTLGSMPIIPLYVQELLPHTQYLAFFAGLAAAMMSASNMLASPFLGKLGDRYGSHYVLFYSLLIGAIFLIPVVFVSQYWQLLALYFCIGLCMGGMLPALNSLIRHYAPDGMESRTYGYATSAMFVGNLIGPVGFGLTAASFGISSVFMIGSLVLFISAVWVKVIIFAVIKPLSKEQARS
jgi:DHA1 family multidrug resistance protein-like MFS transporter